MRIFLHVVVGQGSLLGMLWESEKKISGGNSTLDLESPVNSSQTKRTEVAGGVSCIPEPSYPRHHG